MVETLYDLAELINNSTDYPVFAVEEAITQNHWVDISINSDYDICTDGVDKLVLDENTAIAKVVSCASMKEKIGACVCKLRVEAKMTQQQLSEISGVSRVNITKLENGTYNISLDVLEKILNALKAELKIISKNI